MSYTNFRTYPASMAKSVTDRAKSETVEIPQLLWNNVVRRIEDSAKMGRDETTLGSFVDAGHTARGIGMYLSANMVSALTSRLESLGYKVIHLKQSDMPMVYVNWR